MERCAFAERRLTWCRHEYGHPGHHDCDERAAVIAEVVAKLAHLRGSFAWTLDALDAFDQAIDAVKRLGAR